MTEKGATRRKPALKILDQNPRYRALFPKCTMTRLAYATRLDSSERESWRRWNLESTGLAQIAVVFLPVDMLLGICFVFPAEGNEQVARTPFSGQRLW